MAGDLTEVPVMEFNLRLLPSWSMISPKERAQAAGFLSSGSSKVSIPDVKAAGITDPFSGLCSGLAVLGLDRDLTAKPVAISQDPL